MLMGGPGIRQATQPLFRRLCHDRLHQSMRRLALMLRNHNGPLLEFVGKLERCGGQGVLL